MRKILLIIVLAFLSASLFAQVSNPSVKYVAVAPSGSCAEAPPVQVVDASGAICTCGGGTWTCGGSGGSGTVSPSGDTTGATDGVNISAACASNGLASLAPGMFYVGHSNATITMSTPCFIGGSGPQTTTVQNEGTTNEVFTVSYGGFAQAGNNPMPAGRITNLTIQQDAANVPTAGGAIAIGTGCTTSCGANYTGNFMADHLVIQGVWNGLFVKPGELSNWYDTIRFYSTVAGGGGCVYYTAGMPNGGNQINNLNCGGANSDYTITQSDTNSITNLTMSTGTLRFTQTGAAIQNSFTNFISEDATGSCAVDFGTGGTQPRQVKFTGGHITNVTQAFCNGGVVQAPNGFSGTDFTFTSVGTIDNSNVPTTATAYTWGNVIEGSSGAILLDNFTGTSGVLLSSHVSDTGNSWAQAWTGTDTDTSQLNGSGGVIPSGTTTATSYLSNWIPSSADYTVQATCDGSSSSTICGLVGRGTAGSLRNGYVAQYTPTTGVLLYKNAAGVQTQLGTTCTSVTTGSHIIALIMSGTSISVNADGSPCSGASATDSTFTSAGLVGVQMYFGGSSIILSTLSAH